MKKNLIITLAVLVIAAMATSASAATMTYTGELAATFTHKFDGTEIITPAKLADTATLSLNLTFKEGDKAIAYLPLTIALKSAPTVTVNSKWYAAYASSPVSFWVSDNNSGNAYKFSALGDPLGIVAKLSSGLVINANGSILGANYNIYAADLGDVAAVTTIPTSPAYSKGNAFLGRVTYGLPADFTLGLVGAYTNGKQTLTPPTTVTNDPEILNLGLDVVGKIPGLGAKLTVAVADTLVKEGDWDFDTSVDHLAYTLKLEDINVGPVAAWAKFTGVGADFSSFYKVSPDDDENTILNKYAGKAAVEVEGTVDIPVGIPMKLTLGNGLWFEYPFTLDNNETYAKVVVEPLADLALTVSGAYKADISDVADGDDGWKVHGDAKYTVIGLTINPYIDYKVDSYAKTPDTDFVFGLDLEGSPVQGLTLDGDVHYTVEETIIESELYALFVTEYNPGFVKSAKTTVAGLGTAFVDFDHVDTVPPTDPPTPPAPPYTLIGYGWNAFAGTELQITDKLTGKVGVLAKDDPLTLTGPPEVVIPSGLVVSANLGYTVSDTVSTALTYTYRQYAVNNYTGWTPFDDDGSNYLRASVTSKIGKSTFTVAYGATGLTDGDTKGVNYEKPWNYMVNKPSSAMAWDTLSFSVKVPF